MGQALNWLDYSIMAAYLVITLGIGVFIGRRMKTGKDYFLGGRALPWWAIGMSLVVSDIGALDIMALGGDSYLHGIVLANFDFLGAVPIMVIAGFVFIPYFWRSGVYTIPEYLGKRYNEEVRMIVAAIWSLFLVFNIGIMLYLTAEMMNMMLGVHSQLGARWGVSEEQTITWLIVASAVFVGFYTLIGGLSAVVYTDAIQCVMLLVGTGVALVMGLYNVGGLSGLMETVHNMGPEYQNHFKLVHPVDTETPYPWTGILMGLGFVLAPAYWVGNQSIVQRSLGARSEFEAKTSFMWGSLIKFLTPILMVFPGVVALAHNPEIDDTVLAVPTLISETLPNGLLGVFFAAFLAAFMSSVDSSLNSSVTLITNDFYRRFLPIDKPDEHFLRVGRFITFLFILWGIGFGIWVMYTESSIYTIIQTVFSLFQGPSLAVIVLGVLWSRTTGVGALTGLLIGIASACLLLLTHHYATEPLFQISDPFLYIALWAFLVAFTVTVLVSLITRKEPEEKLVGLVYNYKQGGNAS